MIPLASRQRMIPDSKLDAVDFDESKRNKMLDAFRHSPPCDDENIEDLIESSAPKRKCDFMYQVEAKKIRPRNDLVAYSKHEAISIVLNQLVCTKINVNCNRKDIALKPKTQTLGLVKSRTYSQFCISNFSKEQPYLLKILLYFGQVFLPKGTTFTSIQINENVQTNVHTDTNNLGTSYIIALGDFTGGELWTFKQGIVNIHNTFFCFDGTLPHATLPFSTRTTSRYSLVFYTIENHHKCSMHERHQLLSLGFPLPSAQRDFGRLHTIPNKILMNAGRAAYNECRKMNSTICGHAKAKKIIDERFIKNQTKITTRQLIPIPKNEIKDQYIGRTFIMDIADDGNESRWIIEDVYYEYWYDQHHLFFLFYNYDTYPLLPPCVDDTTQFEYMPITEVLTYATDWRVSVHFSPYLQQSPPTLAYFESLSLPHFVSSASEIFPFLLVDDVVW